MKTETMNCYGKNVDFVIMTTFTVNIEDQKAEKAVKAFLDALELNYKVNYSSAELSNSNRGLTPKEKKIYKGLKNSLQEIKRWENGEIELRDAQRFVE